MIRVSRSITTSAGEQVRHVLTKLPRKMMNNNVLIKVEFNPTEDIVRDSGIIISGLLNSEWSDEVPRFGEVIMTPDKLRIMNKYNVTDPDVCDWGTVIEVKKGDVVYFGAMASANAESFIYREQLYLLIPYSRIICKVSDVITPVNGYCIVREHKNKTERNGILLANKEKTDRRKGTVVANGRNNDYYFGEDAVDADVEVGDELVFTMKMFGYLENKIFASLGEDLGHVQKRWTICKLN